MKSITVLLVLLLSSISYGRGNESGGGGDEIRANFMKLGEEVILFLATDSSGTALADFHRLDIEKLEKTLTIERIVVSDEVLIDRTNSIVDALIRDDKVILNQSRWLAILNSKSDVRYLVFHEMLRLGGTDDDNYIVSMGFREAISRRHSLPDATQSVTITCKEPTKNGSRNQSKITFSKQRNHPSEFTFHLGEPLSSDPLRGNTRDITRMGTDDFRFVIVENGRRKTLDLQFRAMQSSAIVTLAERSAVRATIVFMCSATSSNPANSSATVELPLAIEYIADGM